MKKDDLRAMGPIYVLRLAPQRGADVRKAPCTSKRAGFTVQRALCTSKGEGLTVQKVPPKPQDPQKLATNSLKFQGREKAAKVGRNLAPQDFSSPAQFSIHFNKRIRMGKLGANFGGEVQGGGGRGR